LNVAAATAKQSVSTEQPAALPLQEGEVPSCVAGDRQDRQRHIQRFDRHDVALADHVAHAIQRHRARLGIAAIRANLRRTE
jgi:hypothetical protein